MQRVFFGITALSLVLSLGGTFWRLERRVEPEVLDNAAQRVRATFEEGDVLILEPDYLIGMRERLGDLPILSLRRWDRRDLADYQRVHHVVTESVATSLSGRYALQSWAPEVLRQEWPGVSWVVFEIPPPANESGPVVFRMSERIRDVSVAASYVNTGERPCDRWENDRWMCPRNSGWSWVGPTIEAVGEQPRSCVWLHPLKDGEPLVAKFPAVEGAHRLRGGFGFTDYGARYAQGPVKIRMRVGQQLVMEQTFQPRAGWFPVDRALPNMLPTDGSLELEVSAARNGAAHFCGDVVLEGRPQ